MIARMVEDTHVILCLHIRWYGRPLAKKYSTYKLQRTLLEFILATAAPSGYSHHGEMSSHHPCDRFRGTTTHVSYCIQLFGMQETV